MTGAAAVPEPAGFPVTVLGAGPDSPAVVDVRRRVALCGGRPGPARSAGSGPVPVTRFDVRLTATGEASLRVTVGAAARAHGVDVVLRRPHPVRVAVFDVDSTLITDECIVRLAARAGRAAEIARVTEEAMQGRLGFAESLHLRVAALAGLPESVLADVARESVLTDGAAETVRGLRAAGVRVGAVSGGFDAVVAPLARRLGLDFHLANALEVVGGELTGRISGPVVDAETKARVLRSRAREAGCGPRECVAVGDGANDVPMLTAAGTGIAFCAKAPAVAAADVVISRPRMDLVLDVLDLHGSGELRRAG